MKRDNDYIRLLLFEMEASEDFRFAPYEGTPEKEIDKRLYHINLLTDAGFVTSVGKYAHRLTNSGHDFLEAARDEGIWQRTKDTVTTAGGSATLEILKQIALGYLKKQINDKTGVDIL